MSNASQGDRKAAISAAVSNFLTRYRIPIIVTLVAVLVLVVALFVYFEIRDNRAQAAAEELAGLEESFSAWQEAQQAEEDGADQLRETFIADAEELISRYSGTYAAARARFLRGELHWVSEEWTQASEWYTQVAEEHPENHLAAIALYNAAAAHEEAGGVPAAIESLERLLAEFPESAELPRALFSLGRLQESQEEHELAAEHYRRLVEDYGASNWTNFARDRIIFLTAEGLIEETS